MRWSISIPQFDDGRFDTAGLKAYLTRAEELGFDGGWTLEQAVGTTPLIAPLETLAFAAACTERLRLGVGVLVSTLHDPLQLASAAAGVDRLSHGRLDLGVAPGGGFRDFAAFGVDRATFVSRFVEGLEIMKAAWSDEPSVTLDGRFRTLNAVPVSPKPVQRPHPPIWFGAGAPAAITRAARHGDAFLGAGSSSTARFGGLVTTLRQELEKIGRDPASFPVGKRVYLTVDDDPDRAQERVQAGLHRIYGEMPGLADMPVCGTPEDVVRGLRDVRAAGAEMILCNPLGTTVAEDREQMERLAADVLPHVT